MLTSSATDGAPTPGRMHHLRAALWCFNCLPDIINPLKSAIARALSLSPAPPSVQLLSSRQFLRRGRIGLDMSIHTTTRSQSTSAIHHPARNALTSAPSNLHCCLSRVYRTSNFSFLDMRTRKVQKTSKGNKDISSGNTSANEESERDFGRVLDSDPELKALILGTEVQI